jgi:hypothetical protein
MEKHIVCKILSLKSYQQNEGGDEIFLKLGKKRIWPSQRRFVHLINSPIKINYSIGINRLGEIIELELWEYDNVISRICVGKFMLPINELGGPFVSDIRSNTTTFSKYSLLWELRQAINKQSIL